MFVATWGNFISCKGYSLLYDLNENNVRYKDPYNIIANDSLKEFILCILQRNYGYCYR